MRRLFSVVLVLVAFAVDASAQEARNAAYVELGGSAIVLSANYERRFAPQWYGRIGLSVVTSESESTGDTDTTLVVPLTASYLTRPASNHHFEAGGGITIAGGDRQDLFDSADTEGDFSTAVITGIAGYRYQPPDGGFVFRAVFTPVAGGGDFLPWFGVSFGYAW